MKTTLIILSVLGVYLIQTPNKMKEISKNNMSVKWHIKEDLIHLEMKAPTKGWVAIGFNEDQYLAGAYLLMGHISNGLVEVVEHYTEHPGKYQPIQNYGIKSRILNPMGAETSTGTLVKFSLPINAGSKYHKNLISGSDWVLILAYSQDDDFQHHSIMRTSVKIKL